ncbi:MAG: hypothetical protein NE327_12895 [Lentisphaeraceae bacterium]|nr:hypothetical protein [Lentisphaeraceae bacterium]
MNKVSIKSPCTEDWNKMTGSNSIRNCSKCQFNVYNFSEMSQSEINAIMTSGSRVCARLYLRPDGTYMTKDCKTKIKRKRFHKLIQWAAILPFSFLIPGRSDKQPEIHGPEIMGKPTVQPEIMGEVCIEPEKNLE